MEQDPAFPFRIIVDVATKALSPAINDPTTAVLALDQIHHLLRDVGRRHLDDERVRDASGAVRLIYRTPGWDDFVHLAITEIRQFGGGSIQVARRLRAMLDNLIQVLPPARTELLKQELDLLNRSTARLFADPEDRALAEGCRPSGRRRHARSLVRVALSLGRRPRPRSLWDQRPMPGLERVRVRLGRRK